MSAPSRKKNIAKRSAAPHGAIISRAWFAPLFSRPAVKRSAKRSPIFYLISHLLYLFDREFFLLSNHTIWRWRRQPCEKSSRINSLKYLLNIGLLALASRGNLMMPRYWFRSWRLISCFITIKNYAAFISYIFVNFDRELIYPLFQIIEKIYSEELHQLSLPRITLLELSLYLEQYVGFRICLNSSIWLIIMVAISGLTLTHPLPQKLIYYQLWLWWTKSLEEMWSHGV